MKLSQRFPFKALTGTWDFIVFFFLLSIVFWADVETARLGMDGMTYGALSQNILATGDWKTLHYSSQAYANYYQHPPLVMWLTAAVFSVFGATDITARLLPYLAVLSTFALLLRWARTQVGPGAAWFAGLILLGSTRYVKHSSKLLLDPFLALGLLSGAWILFGLRSQRLPFLKGLFFGGSFVFAFFSKGLPALILLAIGVFWVVWLQIKKGKLFFKTSIFFGVGTLLITSVFFAAWVFLAEGDVYLARYWSESVSSRLGSGSWRSHFEAVLNLARTYWPWLPLFVWSTLRGIQRILRERKGSSKDSAESDGWMLAILFSWGILFGFTLSGNFLEHYLIPFYPFAALVIAALFKRWATHWRPRGLTLLGALGTVLLIGTTFGGIRLHHQDPANQDLKALLQKADHFCSGTQPGKFIVPVGSAVLQGQGSVTSLYLPSGQIDRWWGYAIGLWHTPWDILFVDEPPSLSTPSLALIKKDDAHWAEWKSTGLESQDWQLLQPESAPPLCGNAPARD